MMLLIKPYRYHFLAIMDNSLLPLWLGGMLTGYAIMIKAGVNPRVSWPANLFAVVATTSLVASLLKRMKISNRIKLQLSIAGFLSIIIFYCGVIHWQLITEREQQNINEMFIKSPDVKIDYEIDLWAPSYTLHHPSRYQLYDPFSDELFIDVKDKWKIEIICGE